MISPGAAMFFREDTPLRSRDHKKPLPFSRCQNTISFVIFDVLCLIRNRSHTIKVAMLNQGK